MTVMTKPNKRDVKKSTPVAGPSFVPVVAENVSEVTLGDLSYKELQAEAKARGLKANGSTADLMARLI